MRRVLTFAIIASCSLLALQSRAASICNLSRVQSRDYACQFAYELTQLNMNTGARMSLGVFIYENDQDKTIGCDKGGIENVDTKRQKKNAQQAAVDLKTVGVCDVVITEF